MCFKVEVSFIKTLSERLKCFFFPDLYVLCWVWLLADRKSFALQLAPELMGRDLWGRMRERFPLVGLTTRGHNKDTKTPSSTSNKVSRTEKQYVRNWGGATLLHYYIFFALKGMWRNQTKLLLNLVVNYSIKDAYEVFIRVKVVPRRKPKKKEKEIPTAFTLTWRKDTPTCLFLPHQVCFFPPPFSRSFSKRVWVWMHPLETHPSPAESHFT